MRALKAAVPLIAFALVSCAEQSASWAAAHAEIHGSPPLTRTDVLEIARLICRTTTDPIIAFYRAHRVRGRERVIVVTRLEFGGASGYTVEKTGSFWRILPID